MYGAIITLIQSISVRYPAYSLGASLIQVKLRELLPLKNDRSLLTYVGYKWS
jgi:hypothetical protein